MKKRTREDIINEVSEKGIRFIQLQFTDIFGALKNVTITEQKLEKALDNQCMFDGSSIEGFVRIEESDMYLVPDLDTFTLLPWCGEYDGDERVARLICDIYTAEGHPFEGDPRNVLRRALNKAADMGYTFDVGLEPEFFLFEKDAQTNELTIKLPSSNPSISILKSSELRMSMVNSCVNRSNYYITSSNIHIKVYGV